MIKLSLRDSITMYSINKFIHKCFYLNTVAGKYLEREELIIMMNRQKNDKKSLDSWLHLNHPTVEVDEPQKIHISSHLSQ